MPSAYQSPDWRSTACTERTALSEHPPPQEPLASFFAFLASLLLLLPPYSARKLRHEAYWHRCSRIEASRLSVSAGFHTAPLDPDHASTPSRAPFSRVCGTASGVRLQRRGAEIGAGPAGHAQTRKAMSHTGTLLPQIAVHTLGPRVTLTASARRSTPCSRRARASFPNLISLLAIPRTGVMFNGMRRAAAPMAGARASAA